MMIEFITEHWVGLYWAWYLIQILALFALERKESGSINNVGYAEWFLLLFVPLGVVVVPVAILAFEVLPTVRRVLFSEIKFGG